MQEGQQQLEQLKQEPDCSGKQVQLHNKKKLIGDTNSESDLTQFESGSQVSVYVIKFLCSANQLMLLQRTSILNT